MRILVVAESLLRCQLLPAPRNHPDLAPSQPDAVFAQVFSRVPYFAGGTSATKPHGNSVSDGQHWVFCENKAQTAA
jgi:hypothetical protein